MVDPFFGLVWRIEDSFSCLLCRRCARGVERVGRTESRDKLASWKHARRICGWCMHILCCVGAGQCVYQPWAALFACGYA